MSGRIQTHGGFAACLIIAFLITAGASVPQEVRAEKATEIEMANVCQNWLSHMVYQQGTWAGEPNPTIRAADDIVVDGVVLARSYSISPVGHIVVPILKDLPPVKTYSDENDLDVNGEYGFPQLLREILQVRATQFTDAYGSLDAIQPTSEDALFGRSHRENWDRYAIAPELFITELQQDGVGDRAEVGPLLTSRWHQNSPYNDLAPMGDGGRCVVGCVSTAASQIMKYWEWPPSGIGDYQYWWDGDYSCGGSSPGDWLYADFNNPYDWANMRDHCGGGCTAAQEAAMAELCYEVGVAFSMNYGYCGSGAYTADCIDIMPQYFRFADTIDREDRGSHTPESWFEMIQGDIDEGRPMLYSFRFSANSGHAVVCDGWRDTGGEDQIHINYGWGGSYNQWFAIDEVYPEYDPMSATIYRRIMPTTGFVFVVNPDGSGNFPTIQAAIDGVIEGDVVELGNGTFTGAGNRDLDFHGRAITVRSASGNPDLCIIDCEGNPDNRRGVSFIWGEDENSVLEGVTIANAYVDNGTNGAGILVLNGSTPTIRNCKLENCVVDYSGSDGSGGGLASVASSPTIEDCWFHNCSAIDAGDYGGGVYISGGTPTITGCIFSGCSGGGSGGALAVRDGASLTITSCTMNENSAALGNGIAVSSDVTLNADNCIISFGTGSAVECEGGGSVTMTCSDVVGNTTDWDGCLAGQLGANGNISADPLYCDQGAENYHLQAESPCDPEENPACGLIGALPLGCGAYVVNPEGTGDFPTIQAAIDGVVDGDLIELASGTYSGDGNRDLDYGGKRITIRSQALHPDSVIIDCGGSASESHRGFDFTSGEWASAVLEGVTVMNGYIDVYSGGGIRCNNSHPTITNCKVINCFADASGGGIYTNNSQPTISYTTVAQCQADNGGGAFFSNAGALTVNHCTFSDNDASGRGGGVYCFGTDLTLNNSIISYSVDGEATYCYYSTMALSCCDVYANEGGDWVGCIEGQDVLNDNISEDPLFCDRMAGNYYLGAYSPCVEFAPPNFDCPQIGACGIGCTLEDVEDDGLSAVRLHLGANVPNPFQRSTVISYAIPSAAGETPVRLCIYDAAGRCVRTLVDSDRTGGFYDVKWDGRNTGGEKVAGGVYFYQINVNGEKRTKSMVVVR